MDETPSTSQPAAESKVYILAPMKFNELLCNYRHENNMSLVKASTTSGIEAQMISQLEAGDYSHLMRYKEAERRELVKRLCNAYKGPENKVLEAFDRDFQEYFDAHADESMDEEDASFLEQDKQGLDQADAQRFPALLLKIAIVVLVLLVAAGWIYKEWLDRQIDLGQEETDFSRLVPKTELPIETLPVP